MRSRRIAARSLVFLFCLAIIPGLAAQGRGLAVVAADGRTVGSFKASYALVIGESQYSAGWSKLAGVKTDVKLVSAALSEAGFQVTTKEDLGSDELESAYDDFINAYGYEEGNRLLFYYAGHGHTLKLAGNRDMGYIVPVDAPNPNSNLTGFKSKAIPMQQFDTWAKQFDARHALFLFDSCFSGSIFNLTRSIPDNISDKTVKAVRQFITSGSAEEEVPDKSVFRDQFLAALGGEGDANRDGYVTGAELYEFLHEKVVNYSHRSQTPQYGKIQDPNLDKGDFVFVLPAKAAPPSSANVPPPAAPLAAPTMTIARAYGSLRVSAATAGVLYVDGTKIGDLPAGARADLANIEAGERRLELRYAEGTPETRTVSVVEGQAANVSFSWIKPAPPPPAAIALGDFVSLPAGSFTMGSPASEANRSSDEGPQHEVRLSAFSIGKYEVTQAEWQAVMGSNPSGFKGVRLPVEQVSWYDVLVYCNKRSMKEGIVPCYSIGGSTDPARWGTVPTSSNSTWNAVTCNWSANGYRLPTEAEWEYACRAGTSTATSFGGSLVSSQANFDGNSQYNVSTKGTYLGKTAPVGSYPANAWGIHDMHGNVWEWCWDRFKDTYYASSPRSDPRGADKGSYRVLRGGSCNNRGYNLRSALRYNNYPYYRNGLLGFRVVVGR